MNSAWTRSPQSVDPLSWFTGPLVPVVFGGLTVTYGTAASLLSSRMATTLWLQWPALVCMLVAFTLISTLTQPRRSEFTARRAGIPLVLGWLGLLLSGLGYADGGQHIELWWAPIGLGFIVVALAPYSSSIRMIVAGTLSFLVTLGVVIFAFLPTASYWPPLTYVVLGAGTVAVATAASPGGAIRPAARLRATWPLLIADHADLGFRGAISRPDCVASMDFGRLSIQPQHRSSATKSG